MINLFFIIISDDVCLIHRSLMLINKQFNNIIGNNYEEFNYGSDFESLRCLPSNEMCLNFGKTVDCHLYDGYWIIDVSVGNDYKTLLKNCISLSNNISIDLKSNEFRVSVFGKQPIGLKGNMNGKWKESISIDCKVRFLSYAKYQSMTSRQVLKNKFVSIRNNTGNNGNNSNNDKNNSHSNNTANCFSFVKVNNNDRNENKRIRCSSNYSYCLHQQ